MATYQWSGTFTSNPDDRSEPRLLHDLAHVGGATLRRACDAMGLPTSGTKHRLSERLYSAGLDAATVKARWGWKALHPAADDGTGEVTP